MHFKLIARGFRLKSIPNVMSFLDGPLLMASASMLVLSFVFDCKWQFYQNTGSLVADTNRISTIKRPLSDYSSNRFLVKKSEKP